MTDNSANNKRIAKNTIILYIRTIVILVISLYTSRIILNALGVEDFGIYNAVGGVVAMFTVISGALSSSISRFLTYELGKGDKEQLKIIFSTSVNIQIGLAVIIFSIGEIVGVWFLNYKMNIPPDRIIAANWVLQCSLVTFSIDLISIPYNACIIAHERMDAYAYISILQAILKLLICYAITFSPSDKLITYAILLVLVSIIIRCIYAVYCCRHFEESKYIFTFNKPIMRDMTNFAGWNFFTNSAFVFNTQGVNILINIFFGVTINAARGIATQVENAVMQLVNSFTTAMNPQITKNYASGNRAEMLSLVFRGAKFSYLLLFIIALPVMVEAEYILTLWLKIVPENSVVFVRLAIIASLINIIGKTGYTASMATGNIKRYVLWVTSVGLLAFPLTWIAFVMGAPSEVAYIIFIIVYLIVEAVRLWVMKGLLDFPIVSFINKVIVRLIIVTAISIVIPIMFVYLLDPSWIRFVFSIVICFICSIASTFILGLTDNERKLIQSYIIKKLHR